MNNNLQKEYDEYSHAVFAATGKRVALSPDAVFFDGVDFDEYSSSAPSYWDQVLGQREDPRAEFHRRMEALGQKFPGTFQVLSPSDINAAIVARVTEGKRRRGTGIRSFWGDLLGSIAGAMTDPINIAGLALLGPAAGVVRGAAFTLLEKLALVGRVAAVEGVVGAATEAAIQIPVAAYNKDLGIKYGSDEAL